MLHRFGRRPAVRTLTRRPRLEPLEPRDLPANFNIANGDVAAFVAAVNTCNTNNQADTINLAASGTYSFTAAADSADGGNALPSVLLDGSAANTLTINGNGATLTRPGTAPAFRFLRISAGALIVNGLALTNGNSSTGTSSNAQAGGAVAAIGGSTTLNDCTLLNNQAVLAGGAILIDTNGTTLALNRCTLKGNAATDPNSPGGGLVTFDNTTTTITDSTFDSNTCVANGGGVALLGGTLAASGSTFSNNSSTGSNLTGGGIFAVGSLTLSNSTLSGNRAASGAAIDTSGGSGTAVITNCTITANSAFFATAYGALLVGGTSTSLGNTIVAGNTFDPTVTGGLSPDLSTPFSTPLTSLGYNLIGDGTGTNVTGTTTGNQVGTAAAPIDPKLGPLQNNGGLTQTRALLTGSPAIDAGDPAFAPPPNFDQRGTGFPRVQNGRIDIGAFEKGPSTDLAVTLTDNATSANAGGTTTYTLVVSNAGPASVTKATVADALPTGVTGFTWTTTTTGGATAPAGGSGAINATVDLPAGASVTFTVVASIGATATGTLTNVATVTPPTGTTDTNAANNTASDSDKIIAATAVDLAVTITDNTTVVTTGATTTYAIVVTNAGTAAATGATVTDTLPASLTGATWTTAVTGGATAPASGSGSINATVGLPVGATVTFTLTATVSPTASGTLTNGVTVAPPTGTVDSTPGNNTASDIDTIVSPAADLIATVSDGRSAVAAGGTTTYVVTVRNVGPSAANGTVVDDTLPAAFSGATWTATPAGGATGSAGSGTGSIHETVNLPAGGSLTYVLTAAVAAGANGVAADSVTVAGPTGLPDPNPFNNSASDTDQVVRPGPVFAAGTDAGTPAQVAVFDAATGRGRFVLLPFGAGFTGGARVATGDFNGDGVPDVVAAAGPGGGPAVFVFDDVTGQRIRSFYAYDPRFAGGVYVAVGDVTGDGVPDVITGPGAGMAPRVRVFDGKTGQPAAGPLGDFLAYTARFFGGVRVAAGDVNGDKHVDVITAAGPGGGPHVEAFSGADGSVLRSFFAFAPNFAGGVFVAAGDVNDDGKSDIIAGAGRGGQVSVFSGSDLTVLRTFTPYGASFPGGVRVAAVNVNGQADIVTGAGPGGGPHLRALSGDTLAGTASFFAFDPTFLGGIFVG